MEKTKSQILDWDKIMKIVRAEDQLKEEEAFKRYCQEKPLILKNILERIKQPHQKNPAPK